MRRMGEGGGELKERSQRSERGMELPCWFKVGLSFEMRRLSRTRGSSGEEQDDRILKSSREAVWPEWLRWEKMLVSWGLLLVLPVKAETPRCSETRVCRWRTVWPTYDAEQHRHLKEYTTQDLKALGILSLNKKKLHKRRVGRKTILMLICGKATEQRRWIWVRIWRECVPVYGRQKYTTFLDAEWINSLGWKR
jgi:hypothetical protein